MAVDGAVGYYAVVVIKMIEQLLAENTFLVRERRFSADEISQASGQAFYRAMKPENDVNR